uniref:Uncharacterized protein n=1 Tax=Eutreptiella gymnastica TaxID=73025 RepID=A0A7S1IFM0_9EUGL|mmetsp:Transcript_153704/g.268846  ORF Transcript_153704/g.268846 Transcript_153704/m.268846 type:complete len:213 (+) Transcript_153704:280-918(+)
MAPLATKNATAVALDNARRDRLVRARVSVSRGGLDHDVIFPARGVSSIPAVATALVIPSLGNVNANTAGVVTAFVQRARLHAPRPLTWTVPGTVRAMPARCVSVTQAMGVRRVTWHARAAWLLASAVAMAIVQPSQATVSATNLLLLGTGQVPVVGSVPRGFMAPAAVWCVYKGLWMVRSASAAKAIWAQTAPSSVQGGTRTPALGKAPARP